MNYLASKYIKISIKISLVIIFLLGLPLGTTSAASPATLRVTPVIIPVSLTPHTTQNYQITLENLTGQPMPLRSNLSDFETTGEDGDYSFQDSHTNPLLTWVSVSPGELIIPPYGRASVTVALKTPAKIPVGGYFGMLFFEPVFTSLDKNATKIVPRIGVLILGSVGVQNAKAHPLSLETLRLPLITDQTDVPLLLRVKNTGFEYLTAKPIITYSGTSQNLTRTILEDKMIFPGKIRRWEQTLRLPDNSPFTLYSVKISVSMGGGRVIDEYRTIIVFPYKIALLCLLILIFMAGVIKKRTQLQKALRILLFNH